jgi:hypothetical protein
MHMGGLHHRYRTQREQKAPLPFTGGGAYLYVSAMAIIAVMIFANAAARRQSDISIASFGQASTHAAQSLQSSPTTAFSLTIVIASHGHASTQSSQPEHFSTSTKAGMNSSPLGTGQTHSIILSSSQVSFLSARKTN